jgi:hypothetical protein
MASAIIQHCMFDLNNWAVSMKLKQKADTDHSMA